MAENLSSLGCVNKKSLFIRLPQLSSRDKDLAFLMGYFDGDGNERDAGLTCGSRRFLEDIVERYTLKTTISSHGSAFSLYLGISLFEEMLTNYPESLPRKRCRTKEQALWFNQGLINPEVGQFENSLAELLKRRRSAREVKRPKTRKIQTNRSVLAKELWKIPSEQIAKKLGVSGSALAKLCRIEGISKPGRGYWAKKAAQDMGTQEDKIR